MDASQAASPAAQPHTLVFSDIHLTTVEKADPRRPLWKRYKQRDLVPDASIVRMLEHVQAEVDGPIEVILNGDIFDFDAVTELPTEPGFLLTWLERLRGLNPTEVKSAWKMVRMLDDHPQFVAGLQAMLRRGHRVVFVVGNHDIELHWPAVQRELRDRLEVEGGQPLVVADWFYVSNGDTLVEHGNQYDSYCLCLDPLSPTVRVPPSGEARMRLPFGNYAARYMVNGMGLINPHANHAFIMPFWGYVVFFYRHVARTQPLLAWTWMWTAVVTFVASFRDGVLPSERDVLHLEDWVDAVAERAQSTPRVARALDALKAHPAIYYPWKVARELWLDRLFLVLLLLGGSFQMLATLKVFADVSWWWWFALLAVVFPPFLIYAQNVSSDVDNLERVLRSRLPAIRHVVGVDRIVLGHTHRERHTRLEDVEVLNAGTWSPAYKDVACTEPVGRKCVVRLWPRVGAPREATLESWTDAGFERLPFEEARPLPLLPRPVPVARPTQPTALPTRQRR